MISDSQFIELDSEIWSFVGAGAEAPSAKGEGKVEKAPIDAALPDIVALPDTEDERRIERIIEKARFEAVMKDSVSFLFKTMGVGMTELTSGVIAASRGEARSAGSAADAGEPSNEDSETPEA